MHTHTVSWSVFCRDSHGNTPFMAAVKLRAYSVALTIFDTTENLASHRRPLSRSQPPSSQGAGGQKREEHSATFNKELFESMVFPPGSHPDSSPLYVLCCNDTCSFTWTGTEHINQVLNHLNTLFKSKRHSFRCHDFLVHAYLLSMCTNVVDFNIPGIHDNGPRDHCVWRLT